MFTPLEWLTMLTPGLIIALGFAIYIAHDEYKQRQKRKRWAAEDEAWWNNFDREFRNTP